MCVSTRGIDAEFIIAATYIFIVTGRVTQDIGTKSAGSEIVTVKLSRCPADLLSCLMLMNFYAPHLLIRRCRHAVERDATSEGTRQRRKKRAWLMKVQQYANAARSREHRLRELQRRIYGAKEAPYISSVALYYCFARSRNSRIRSANNILRVRNICKDSTSDLILVKTTDLILQSCDAIDI